MRRIARYYPHTILPSVEAVRVSFSIPRIFDEPQQALHQNPQPIFGARLFIRSRRIRLWGKGLLGFGDIPVEFTSRPFPHFFFWPSMIRQNAVVPVVSL